MFYFKLCFLLALPLFGSSNQINDADIFVPVTTLDGVPVIYQEVSSEDMYSSGKSVAFAVYDDNEARIVYDLNLFEKLDGFSKFLIIEHERAHHYLGHSLASKTYKELNLPLENMSLLYRKENDADCAAGFKAKEVFPNKNRSDVLTSFKSIYDALTGGLSPDVYPSWVYNRADKTSTCLEGVLLPYPEVIRL